MEAVGYTGKGLFGGSESTVDLSPDLWQRAFSFLIALILSVAVHEFGHAWMATRLGDSLPAAQGRLTLNPIRHADPVGTVVLPLIMLTTGFGVLGWGRPVLTNPANYTRSIGRATGHMLVSIAGPAMNLLMALLVSLFIVVGARVGMVEAGLADGLNTYLVQLNLILMFFNLLPIPPLDGGAVLAWVLPRSMHGVMDFLSRWGFMVLIGMLVIPVQGQPILGHVFRPAYYLIGIWTESFWGLAGL